MVSKLKEHNYLRSLRNSWHIKPLHLTHFGKDLQPDKHGLESHPVIICFVPTTTDSYCAERTITTGPWDVPNKC